MMMTMTMRTMAMMLTSTSPSEVHSRLVGEWLIGSYPLQGPETRHQEILIVIISCKIRQFENHLKTHFGEKSNNCNECGILSRDHLRRFENLTLAY